MQEPAGIIIYALVCGFVAAGLLHELHQIIQRDDEENESRNGMILHFHSPTAFAWSIFVCVFAGPYLVLSQGLRFWRMEVLPGPALAMCGLVCVIWSFCSGVFIVEALFALGIVG